MRRCDSFSYDVHNRLLSVVHPDSSHVDYTYDSRGNLTSVKDENHLAANTTYAYDALNRLRTVTQDLADAPGSSGACAAAAGQIATCYDYDSHDNLISVTDPNGNQTPYAYDDFRRMQKQTSPVSGMTTYSYDAAGNLLSSTDANAATTTRFYDFANRIVTSSAVRSGLPTETTTWEYDSSTEHNYGIGRLSSMTDQVGSTTTVFTTYSYERRGLLKSETRTIQGHTHSLGYGYDKNGNRTSIRYPSGRTATYVFDCANRPTSVTFEGMTYVSSTAYEPFGPEMQLNFGNGTTKYVFYDQRYQPTENKLTNGLGTLADYTYAEDSVGNIIQIHDTRDPNYNRDFLPYDDLNRLTTATSGSALWGSGGYTYDPMGNLKTLNLGSNRTTAFSYSGTLPKLTSIVEDGVTRAFAYDAAGNETTFDTSTYSYSPRNLLSSTSNTSYNDEAFSYLYDGRGLRAVTTFNNGISLFSLAVSPISIVSGATATGTVTLGDAAPAGGLVVNLSSSNTNVATVPASVTVPAGATAATFLVTAQTIANVQSVGITARYGNNYSDTAWITVTPFVLLSAVTIDPPSLVKNATRTGTVTLNGPAPAGGASVTLTSSNILVVTVLPNPLLIPAGSTSAPFTVAGGDVSNTTTAYVTGSYGGGSQSVVVTVTTELMIYSLSLNPTTVTGPGTSMGTIWLNGPAPSPSGAAVTVTSSNTSVATVPSPVTVMSGQMSQNFMVTAFGVPITQVSAINGVYGGQNAYANLTVKPATTRTKESLSEALGSDFFSFAQTRFSLGSAKHGSGGGPGLFRLVGRVLSAVSGSGGREASPKKVLKPEVTITSPVRRYSFYSPDMSLLAESEMQWTGDTAAPAIIYEYIWLNGHPVGQVDGGVINHWTFTDHLGTPIIQTDASGNIYWQAEYEPYGRVFALRTADQHQPLRFPGQEAEQMNLGQNGKTDRKYNIFRWYRARQGRYTSSDPLDLQPRRLLAWPAVTRQQR